MLISIIITNYNYGDYLAEAIDSALNQSGVEREVIVVDDGSTDRSPEIIAGYGASIKSIFKTNGGQCSAFNAGFALSRGDVVMLLDSDDYLLSGAAAALAEPIANDGRVAKSQGYLRPIGRKWAAVRRTLPRRLPATGDYRDATLRRGPGACRHAFTSGNAWARWFLEHVMPLPETDRMGLDACLSAVATLFGDTVSLDRVVAAYRIHDRNLGPAGETFSVPSLRRIIDRRTFAQDYLAQWARRLGYDVPVDVWRTRGASWRDGVLVFSLASLEKTPRQAKLGDLLLSPFKSGHTIRLKALIVSAALALLWLLPRTPALALARRMLRLPKSEQFSPATGQPKRPVM